MAQRLCLRNSIGELSSGAQKLITFSADSGAKIPVGPGTLRVLSLALGLLLFATLASASDIYVAQNAVGNANGADCNDAYGIAWADSASNWGSAPNKIGPGTTVHLCSTITAAPGAPAFTFNGSGTSGNPITLKFESGSVVQSAYFPGNPDGGCNSSPCGGIQDIGYNYITIDGANVGIVQNTADGSSLSNQQPSIGVFVQGDHLLVKNLTIQNIYQNCPSGQSCTDQGGFYSADLNIGGGSTNVEVCNNTLTNAHIGLSSDSNGSVAASGPSTCMDTQAASGVNYYNNTLSDHGWQMSIVGQGIANVYNNDLSGWGNWFNPPTNFYHLDGIITFGDSGDVINTYVYGNYIHGDFIGSSPTGFVFCTYGSPGSGSACHIFNNLFVGTGGTATGGQAIYFHSADGNPLGPHYIYNNTFSGFAYQLYFDGDSTQHFTIENNVFIGNGNNWFLEGNSSPLSNLVANYNVYYNGRNLGPTSGPFSWGAVSNGSLSTWQAAGQDANAIGSNPDVDATFHIQAGSPVIGHASNLAGLGISSLNTGKPTVVGVSGLGTSGAQQSSSWDPGSYPYASSSSAPSPPQGLQATVN